MEKGERDLYKVLLLHVFFILVCKNTIEPCLMTDLFFICLCLWLSQLWFEFSKAQDRQYA